MPRRQEGKGGGIHDPQAAHTDDPSLIIHNGLRIVGAAHGAGSGGVEHGAEAPADDIQDLSVGVHGIGAGEEFRPDQDRLHGVGAEELSRTLVAGDRHCNVRGMGEPVGVDDGRVGGVGRGDVDGASGERCHERDQGAGVVEAVVGRVADEVLLEAEEAADEQVLDLGPIAGEVGQVRERAVGE